MESTVAQSPLARKLSVFVALPEADLEVMSALFARRRRFPKGCELVFEGQSDQKSYVLASGWVCSYKLLSNGARQIVDFQIPGDFLGFRSVLFRTADHSIEPITRIEASEVTKLDLLTAFSTNPRLAAAVLWAASRDEAMVVEHLVGMGRRNAIERMAHFLLELDLRLRLVGMSDKIGYSCPLTQYMLADALGISPVHVNRVLRDLREAQMCTFQAGRVKIHDYKAMVAMCGFDKSYLDHEGLLLT